MCEQRPSALRPTTAAERQWLLILGLSEVKPFKSDLCPELDGMHVCLTGLSEEERERERG